MDTVWAWVLGTLWLIWQLQLPFILYICYRTAKKTGRSVLNWIFMGVVMSVIPPPLSICIAVAAYLWYPPSMPRTPRAQREERHDDRLGGFGVPYIPPPPDPPGADDEHGERESQEGRETNVPPPVEE